LVTFHIGLTDKGDKRIAGAFFKELGSAPARRNSRTRLSEFLVIEQGRFDRSLKVVHNKSPDPTDADIFQPLTFTTEDNANFL
jgi:hypothetical protein